MESEPCLSIFGSVWSNPARRPVGFVRRGELRGTISSTCSGHCSSCVAWCVRRSVIWPVFVRVALRDARRAPGPRAGLPVFQHVGPTGQAFGIDVSELVNGLHWGSVVCTHRPTYPVHSRRRWVTLVDIWRPIVSSAMFIASSVLCTMVPGRMQRTHAALREAVQKRRSHGYAASDVLEGGVNGGSLSRSLPERC